MLSHDVVDCVLHNDYVLRVHFDDGFERTIDFEPILLGPLFGPLRDLRLFMQTMVDGDFGTIDHGQLARTSILGRRTQRNRPHATVTG